MYFCLSCFVLIGFSGCDTMSFQKTRGQKRHPQQSKAQVVCHNYRPKRSFGQGNIFTPVCHSVHRGVSQHALQVSPGGVWSGGSPIFQGVSNFSGVFNFSGGGGLQFFWGWSPIFLGVGNRPPWEIGDHPPQKKLETPRDQTPPNNWRPPFPQEIGDHHPPPRKIGDPPGTRHRNTVNVRPVRILLECILVNESMRTTI